jgi:hypothetical protein
MNTVFRDHEKAKGFEYSKFCKNPLEPADCTASISDAPLCMPPLWCNVDTLRLTSFDGVEQQRNSSDQGVLVINKQPLIFLYSNACNANLPPHLSRYITLTDNTHHYDLLQCNLAPHHVRQSIPPCPPPYGPSYLSSPHFLQRRNSLARRSPTPRLPQTQDSTLNNRLYLVTPTPKRPRRQSIKRSQYCWPYPLIRSRRSIETHEELSCETTKGIIKGCEDRE